MPNGDGKEKTSKAADIASQAVEGTLGKTAEGFDIKPVEKSLKNRRTSKRKKKQERADKTAGFDASVQSVKEQLPVESAENVDFVPLAYKNSFNDQISGGGTDDEGYDLTSKGQLVNSIVNKDGAADTRSLDEVALDVEAAMQFDGELTAEQEKAQALQFAIDPDIQKLKSPETQPVPTTAQDVPYLTTTDIENEMTTIAEGAELGDLESINKFNNMLERVKRTPVNYGEPALERLGLQDYYPDVNMPLQVGTYSGSIVGSNPIFVAGGGLIPVGIIDARKRAMERAAASRVKKGEKLKELMLVPSAEQYQDKIHERGLNIFNKYGESTGWDYNKLNDMSTDEGRAFQKEYQEYRANAKRTIAIQKQYETTLKEMTTGDRHIPQHVLRAMEQWQSGVWDVESLTDTEMLTNIERTMQSYDNMTKDAEALSKDIQKDRTFFGAIPETEEEFAQYEQELELIRSAKRYDILRGGDFKYVPLDRINRLVETKVNHKNYYNPEQTKLDMVQYLNDLISKEIAPKYIEANKGGGTRVTVNNAPKDVTQSNESRILGNMSVWKSALASALPMGDRAVATEMSNNLGLEPKVDDNGNFENGEIRGSYSLTKDQNNREQSYNFSEMRFTPAGSTDRLSLEQYQDRIVKKNGLAWDSERLNNFKISKGIGDNEFAAGLVAGRYGGITFTPEEAWVLSRNANSTANTRWNRKEYVQKYQDQSGGWNVIKMDSSPEVSSGSVPFNEVFAGVIDESVEGGGIFAGFTVFVDYNLNNSLGDLPAIDTQNTGASGVMKKENVQGNISATQREGGTGDQNIEGSPPQQSGAPIVLD